ncbi:hypothetical protein JHW43_003889 [Diplocarpon mali]|nr:hypothetical protein JHW43_003889 [Diplocarpon mali]
MDLPNLRTKPTYDTLLDTLKSLQIKPASWDGASLAEVSRSENDASVNTFLMSVIACDFGWLTDFEIGDANSLAADDQKENLIQEASKRVAERCGRSAAGEMTRTWLIPKSLAIREISFRLREPPLTGDMLGLKTWGTSYVIAKKLEHIGSEFLGGVINRFQGSPQVLELGAGTGLVSRAPGLGTFVGMAAAAIWATNVVLTDLEDIQDNLLFNIEGNLATVEGLGGSMSGRVLDWTTPDTTLPLLPSKEFEIVIAADPMYDNEHPDLVAKMIQRFLKQGTETRALVAIPLRDNHTRRMEAEFSNTMMNSGFCVVHQGSEIFKDDWGTTEEVQVQWTIWRRFEGSGTAED